MRENLFRMLEHSNGTDGLYSLLIKSVVPHCENLWKKEIVSKPEYTLHGVDHITNVIDNLTGLLQASGQCLNAYELFVLLASAYLHDVGMLVGQRETHHLDSEIYVKQNAQILGLERLRLYYPISIVVKGHRKVDLSQSEFDDYPLPRPMDDISIKRRLLASVLRIADEMDVYQNRAPKELYSLLKEKGLPSESIFEWIKHFYIDSIRFLYRDHGISAILNAVVPNQKHKKVIEVVVSKIEQEIKSLPKLKILDMFSKIKIEKHIEVSESDPNLECLSNELLNIIFRTKGKRISHSLPRVASKALAFVNDLDISFDRHIMKSIVGIALENGCDRLMIEKSCYDQEWYEEYYSFYSKLFEKYPILTHRIYFLKESSVIASCTVRPKTDRFLSVYCLAPKSYRENDNVFLPCDHFFSIDIFSKTEKIKCSPYIQDDGAFSCCGTAVIWMNMKMLSKIQSISPASFANINPNKLRGNSLPLLGHTGIIEHDIQLIFEGHNLRYKNCYCDYNNWADSVVFIESHVSSRIPVLLALETDAGGHAVTVIGLEYDFLSQPVKVENMTTSQYIRSFIVHDTAKGLYMKLPVKDFKKKSIFVAVGLPQQILFGPEDATISSTILLRSLDLIKHILKLFPLSYNIEENIDIDNLILHTFFDSSMSFIRSLKDRGASNSIASIYQKLRLPDYVVVTEISTLSALSNEKKVLGEIVYDSTKAVRYDRDKFDFLSIHLPGLLIVQNPDKKLGFKALQLTSKGADKLDKAYQARIYCKDF
jgi:hypothetical protein